MKITIQELRQIIREVESTVTYDSPFKNQNIEKGLSNFIKTYANVLFNNILAKSSDKFIEKEKSAEDRREAPAGVEDKGGRVGDYDPQFKQRVSEIVDAAAKEVYVAIRKELEMTWNEVIRDAIGAERSREKKKLA